MKNQLRHILIGSSLVFIMLIFHLAHAGSSVYGKVFGGRILNTTATEIQELEDANYKCAVPGTTFTMRAIGSPAGTPTSYFIPYAVKSRTKIPVHSTNQLIMGGHNSKEVITCTYKGYPPRTQTVTLDSVTVFGTSRR